MELKYTTPVILVIIGVVMAWVVYELGMTAPQQWMLCGVTFVEFCIAAISLIFAGSVADERMALNIKVFAYSMLALGVLMSVIFSFFDFSPVGYVAPSALLMLIMLAGSFSLARR